MSKRTQLLLESFDAKLNEDSSVDNLHKAQEYSKQFDKYVIALSKKPVAELADNEEYDGYVEEIFTNKEDLVDDSKIGYKFGINKKNAKLFDSKEEANNIAAKIKDSSDWNSVVAILVDTRELHESRKLALTERIKSLQEKVALKEATVEEVVDIHERLDLAETVEEVKDAINSIVDNSLQYQCELALEQAIKDGDDLEALKSHVIATLEDNAVYEESASQEDNKETLINDLVKFMYDYDEYGFRNDYNSDEEFAEEIRTNLESNEGIDSIIAFFDRAIEESDSNTEVEATMRAFINRLSDFKTAEPLEESKEESKEMTDFVRGEEARKEIEDMLARARKRAGMNESAAEGEESPEEIYAKLDNAFTNLMIVDSRLAKTKNAELDKLIDAAIYSVGMLKNKYAKENNIKED